MMDDGFITIARSNEVQTPRDRPSDDRTCEMVHIKDLWPEEWEQMQKEKEE